MASSVTSFLESVQTAIDRNSLKYSEWLQRNFKNPRNDRHAWSFKDHEFQIAIVDETSPEVCVKKCAQIGLSVLQVRFALTFCSVNDYLKAAYILPTSKFALEFATTRIDPAIESSDHVSSLMSKDVDNAGAKKIGTCFLLMRGTTGTVTAISQDLDLIITDEKDFCNADVLGSFASRLQHSDLKWTRDFSTPTVPDYGISADYDDSSQAVRMIKHDACKKWVFLDPFKAIVIPGFEKPVEEFRKVDWNHPGVAKAYLACPHCKRPISIENLNDPEKRQWVHRFKDVAKRGYHVRFWDVPKYNQTPEVLASIRKYKLHSDWVNFRLGEDYADAESSFLVNSMHTVPHSGWSLESVVNAGVGRVFIGGDLGKSAHILVGVGTPRGLRLIAMGRPDVRTLPGANLGVYLVWLFRQLHGIKSVIDASPNYETALYMHQTLPEKQAYGAYFGGLNKSDLDIYQFSDAKGVVHIDRDASFDDVSKAFNSGLIEVGSVPLEELKVFKKHLTAMKKIKQYTSKGEEMKWISTGPDHYALALNYLFTAYASVNQRHNGVGISVMPGFSGVRMKQK